jgi:UDPglucose 6-dehydrogenase
MDYNSERKKVIIAKIKSILGGKVSGKTISALGLTYKPGTSTLRKSLPLEIVELLSMEGAKLRAYDPKADFSELDSMPAFVVCSSIDDALSGSHLVVLFTEWNDFKKYNWQNGACLMRDAKFFDTKNFLADCRMSGKGFQYIGVGFARP